MISGIFFSRAKLILLGEYAVLQDKNAVCLPLSTGQFMSVETFDLKQVHWLWKYKDQVIADFVFNSDDFNIIHAAKGDPIWVKGLVKIIRKYNPDFLVNQGCKLSFTNFFPVEWGLGSSSATISSLCRLAEVDPYKVNTELMGGSGADIACTTANKWFIYRKKVHHPETSEIPADFRFPDQVFFIYSGKKQPTASHLRSLETATDSEKATFDGVNELVSQFLNSRDLFEFCRVIEKHEQIISKAIGKPIIKNSFPDFVGTLKSLGAWGGDFFMAISESGSDYVKKYFHDKGYNKVFTWNELVNSDKF
jgi:mevalonate kinase